MIIKVAAGNKSVELDRQDRLALAIAADVCEGLQGLPEFRQGAGIACAGLSAVADLLNKMQQEQVAREVAQAQADQPVTVDVMPQGDSPEDVITVPAEPETTPECCESAEYNY